MLLALDPGLNSPGIAVFNGSTLIGATRVNGSEYKDLPDGERWLRVARLLFAYATSFPLSADDLVDVVFEKPQWYQRTKSKGDPNQLVGLAGVAAAFAALCSTRAIVHVASPTPAEWIGQLPKVCPACKGKAKKKCAECHGSAWETPRGRRIRSRLTEAELALVPDQNDAIDAVGLGLWQLGRLAPRSVFSNGRD